MKRFFPLLPLAATLCVSLFFSCSNTPEPPPYEEPNSGGNSTNNICVYKSAEKCFEVGSQTTCPNGGELSSFCPPFGNTTPGSSSPSSEPSNPSNPDNYSYYCVYTASKQCFAASSPNCPAGGELSTFCPPFDNPNTGSSTTPSSPSTATEPNDHYCVFPATELCLAVSASTNCSALGGELSASCPFKQTKPSSASEATIKSSSSINNSTLPSSSAGNSSASTANPTPSPTSGAGPVPYYGKLKASGNKLIGSRTGTAVQVRGVSLFWSNTGWGGDRFFTATTVNAMVDSWKAEVIRVPIGYSEDGGYKTDASNLTRVKTAIDAAIAKGVYVIIDWHSHNAHNETSAATAFFKEMAQTYGSKDHVIFEIYNEPTEINGGTWANIKTYASSIISTIRQYSDNLILVGTPNWDQDVNVAATSPISADNIAYVFHFYAVDHTRAFYESNLNAVLSANLPIFVSEYGTTEASGDGAHSAANTDAWHSYMDANKISSCAWSVNDKRESSAFFGVGTFNMSNWTNTSSMTASGQYIYNKLNSYANSAPWRSGSGSVVQSSNSVTVVSSSSATSGGTSNTRCKDGSGRDYFCEWGGYISDYECWALDPTYATPAGQTCSALISECNLNGTLFISSTTEGEGIRCNGTTVSGSTTTSSSSGGTSETGGPCIDGGSYAYCNWGGECSEIDNRYGYIGISEAQQTCGPLAYALCSCADLIQSCKDYSDSKTVYHNYLCSN